MPNFILPVAGLSAPASDIAGTVHTAIFENALRFIQITRKASYHISTLKLKLMPEIRQLTPAEARHYIPSLANVLKDCVDGGASVNFMAGFSQGDAEAFFSQVAASVERGERILLAAFLNSQLVGTVQVVPATPPNQPYRADVAKLLVSRTARHQGVATMLMQAAEQAALSSGRTLLVLDTVTGGAAERLYNQLGWIRVGVIPDYCLYPDGTLCGTTIFYKQLSQGGTLPPD